jgi:hypothetical protein
MDWNAVQLRAPGRGHVESFFCKATAPEADRAFWLRATILSGAEGTFAEAWAIAFERGRPPLAWKGRAPYASASFGRAALDVAWHKGADRLRLSAGATSGQLRRDDREVRWDLSFAGDDRPLALLPSERLYDPRLPNGKVVSPGPDLRFSGEIVVDGRSWQLDAWRGMQGHNWGRRQPESYAWTHCNQWREPEDLVLEAISARVAAGPLVTPVLTMICLRHRGRDHHFKAALDLVRTRAEVGLRRYAFEARRGGAAIEAVIDADAEDFAGLHYPNPDGSMRHCLNAKLARAQLRFSPAGGRPVQLSSDAAALEILTPRADHGIKMLA